MPGHSRLLFFKARAVIIKLYLERSFYLKDLFINSIIIVSLYVEYMWINTKNMGSKLVKFEC